MFATCTSVLQITEENFLFLFESIYLFYDDDVSASISVLLTYYGCFFFCDPSLKMSHTDEYNKGCLNADGRIIWKKGRPCRNRRIIFIMMMKIKMKLGNKRQHNIKRVWERELSLSIYMMGWMDLAVCYFFRFVPFFLSFRFLLLYIFLCGSVKCV